MVWFMACASIADDDLLYLGVHVFADSHAHGLGEDSHWLYTVVFEAAELWGAQAVPGHRVSFDAWEPYLEEA